MKNFYGIKEAVRDMNDSKLSREIFVDYATGEVWTTTSEFNNDTFDYVYADEVHNYKSDTVTNILGYISEKENGVSESGVLKAIKRTSADRDYICVNR